MYHLAWVAAVNCCSWSQFRLYPFPFNVDYVVRCDPVVGHLDQVSHLILAFELEDAEHSLLLAVFSVREKHVPLTEVLDLLDLPIGRGDQRASSKTRLGGATVIARGAVMELSTFPKGWGSLESDADLG